MAFSKQTELSTALVQYLSICRELGETDTLLSSATREALNTLRDAEKGDGSRNRHWRESSPLVAETTAPSGAAESTVPVGQDPLVGLPKSEALEALRNEILQDRELGRLFEYAQNMVFGSGDPDAAICFIGEAPGAEEDQAGEPFVGKAGQLLTKMIQTMGLTRSSVYIANLVKYRPDMPPGSAGNRKPTAQEMAACRPYTVRQIHILQPQVIVALGATATEGLLQKPRLSITRVRGQWQEFDHTIPVMPTFHPSYLLRSESISEKRKVWEDLLQVMEKVQLPISEKQRRFFKSK